MLWILPPPILQKHHFNILATLPSRRSCYKDARWNITAANDTLSSSWRLTLAYPKLESHYVYEPAQGDTAFLSTLYKFTDEHPNAGENCYQVNRFFPLSSNSAYYPPGTESLPSEELCLNTLGLDPANELAILPLYPTLRTPYPHPFNPSTTIQFDLPAGTNIRIVVYDLLGREVVRLVDQHLEPGVHQVILNGRDAKGRGLLTGIFIARLGTPDHYTYTKMLLLR